MPVPPQVAARCPSLGFEDDASSSFARPTRLHRCFAANSPLPLSLDQQRELCLTDHFGTCPRLSQGTPAAEPASSGASPAPSTVSSPSGRIVRLPTMGRQPAADRSEAAEPTVASGPRPLRAVAAARATGAADGETQTQVRPAPTPLRARLQRAAAGATASVVAEPPGPTNPERRNPANGPGRPSEPPTPVKPERRAAPDATAKQPAPADTAADERRPRVGAGLPLSLGSGRIVPILGAGLAIVLIAALTYFLAPQIMSVLGGDSVDTTNLPNARLAEEGTPVSQIAGRATPVSRAPAAQPTAAAQAPTAAQPAADSTATGQAQPAVAGVQTASDSQATATSASPDQTAAPSAPLFDEKFIGNNASWPSDPQGVAQLSNGSYHIGTRQAGQFVAIGAPMANLPSDVVVNATLQKLGGPPGGGYGIILRNQDPTSLDGNNQNGHYYVLEAGDKGEVGIWRRDGDHWVDLLPWQHSDAVKTGSVPNELSARAVGNTLSLSINGTTVATRTDATFSSGTVGLFVGGDGNQVTVTHFAIQNP